ncbi:MFS transporter [Acidiphilium sp. 20-67-58]|jgi:FSR family fosmidomycin resistance protein-like MFS transporter|uniref:MFS transporter n=2 Tax=Acidiphilium TaxID=522 RepID=UPI0025BC6F62|nr:MFS transporter [Acidiphilium sp. 20-67-58]
MMAVVMDQGLRTVGSTVRYGRLAALSWLHFLNDGSANYLPGVLPAVLVAMGEPVSLAGTVMAALLIGQALQVGTGLLADRFGGRGFIAAGVLGTALAAALIGRSGSLALLLPALVLIGISNAMFHPQALAGARQLSGPRVGLGMSLFLVGGEVGRGLWPLIASFIVVTFGLKALSLLAIPAMASILLLWAVLPVQPPRHVAAQPIAWRRHLGPMSALVAFQSLRALAIFGTTTFLPVLWHLRGHSLTAGAALITVMLVVGIIGNVGGGHLADRIGRRPILAGSSLAGAALLAAFLLTSGAAQWIALGLLGIALFATLPVGILVGQDIFPENRSLGSGIALGLSNGLAAVGLMGLGLISAAVPPLHILWLLVAILFAASLLALRLEHHPIR